MHLILKDGETFSCERPGSFAPAHIPTLYRGFRFLEEKETEEEHASKNLEPQAKGSGTNIKLEVRDDACNRTVRPHVIKLSD